MLPLWQRSCGEHRAAEMASLRLKVSGSVQGVGFRWFARGAARRLGLDGWVRNSDDGSVEIAVGGDDALVERFIAEVERGPDGSRVEKLSRFPTAVGERLPRPFIILDQPSRAR